jgi:hypothetical protein
VRAAKSEKGRDGRQPSKTLKQVLDYIKAGGTDPDAVSALAGKLNRMSAEMTDKQHNEVRAHAGGKSIDEVVGQLVAAIDEANVETKARELNPGATDLTEILEAPNSAHQEGGQAVIRSKLP